MASATRSPAGSAGGKILRPRRVARVATPYERPPNPYPRPENPNWISKLIFSPTRVIASGAGKLLSSVFGSESSSSSSGSDSDSDNEIEEDNNGSDKPTPRVDELNEETGKSEIDRRLTNDSQQAAVVNENKLLIEQLLLRETFSWEEYERLTSIIKSRVLEAPVCLDREISRPSEMHSGAAVRDVEMPDLCNTALMEAKKWLKEKKLGSSPVHNLDPSVSPHANDGSPVDVAKSYMRERPPWTSPCFNSEAKKSASPIGIQLFKDDELFSSGGYSLSSSRAQMKRDTPIIGSWNISDEIRRVRSKATEQMLRTPSAKIDLSASELRSSAKKFDWSGSALGNKYSVNSSALNISKAGSGEKNQTSAKLIDTSSDMPALNTANGTPTTTEKLVDYEVPPVDPPFLISEQDKDFLGKMTNIDRVVGDGAGDTKTIMPSNTCGADGMDHSGTNGSTQQHVDIIPDSRADDGVCLMSKEDASVPNGLSHSTSRSNADERDIRPYDEELNPPTSSRSLPPSQLEETCELSKEAPTDAPNANNNDDTATGSQTSSSVQQQEELMQDVSQQSTKQEAAAPKRGRKVTRFGRKVGRGK